MGDADAARAGGAGSREGDAHAAILLAAGASTRLGRARQLIEIDGESLLRRAAFALFASAYADLLGVPALLPRTWFAEVAKLRGDIGARELLRGRAREVVAIGASALENDLDTLAGLDRKRRQGSAKCALDRSWLRRSRKINAFARGRRHDQDIRQSRLIECERGGTFNRKRVAFAVQTRCGDAHENHRQWPAA